MTELEIRDILGRLRKIRADLTHVEAKAAETELPKRLWETLSAFSNTRGGGTLILGISEEASFAVSGVRHASKMQQDLVSMCSSMEPPIRPHIEVHEIKGEAQLSHYEVQMLLSARGQPKEDEEPVPGTGVGDLQPRLLRGLPNRLRKWLATLREERKVEVTTEQARSKNARYRAVANQR